MASANVYIQDLNAEVDTPKDSIVSRSLYEDDHLKVILFGFAAGQELSEHTASMAASIHVLRGEAAVTLGTEAHHASSGSWAHMPAGLPHSVVAQTDLVMLLLMFKDARE